MTKLTNTFCLSDIEHAFGEQTTSEYHLDYRQNIQRSQRRTKTAKQSTERLFIV